MEVIKYKSYDEYKNIQESTNKRKINWVFAKEENIKLICDYLKENIPNIKYGICHGTRNGKEQEWFIKYLNNCDVFGTEISTTAVIYPNTIKWDFHEADPTWIGSFDFIYSNSLDHSYKPEECLDTWMSCLKPNGICVLEWDKSHNLKNQLSDPFSASFDEYIVMINKKYKIKQILNGILKRKLIFITK
jgi:SAM-dependent methyltransferase